MHETQSSRALSPRKPLLHLIAVVGGIALGVLAFHLAGTATASFDPSDAGLGKNTVSRMSEFDGRRITARGDRVEAVGEIQDTFSVLKATGQPIALWFGASQMHAINNPKPDDQLASLFATRSARSRESGLSYLQVSSPNANLHDLLSLYLVMRQDGHRPDWVIVAMVYDDLSETGVQGAIVDQLDALAIDTEGRFGPGWSNVAVEFEARAAKAAAPVERTILDATPQQRLEDAIVDRLESNWFAFANRGRLAASIKFASTRSFVSLASGVAGRRTRLIPNASRDWNMQALDSFIALSQEDGFELFVYKQPHLPDQPVFRHDRAAYDAFFERLEQDARSRGYHYADLERLVPAEFWGLTNEGVPDAFHFREEGHRRLGPAVDAAIAGWVD